MHFHYCYYITLNTVIFSSILTRIMVFISRELLRSAEAAAISSLETRAAESMAQQQQQQQQQTVRGSGLRFAARPSSLIAAPDSLPVGSRPASGRASPTTGSNGSRTLPSSPATAKRVSLDATASASALCAAPDSRLVSQPGAMRRMAMLNSATANASGSSSSSVSSLVRSTPDGRPPAAREQLELGELPVDASLLIARTRGGAPPPPPPPPRRSAASPAPLLSQREALQQPAFPLTSALPAIARMKASRLLVHNPVCHIILYNIVFINLLILCAFDYTCSLY